MSVTAATYNIHRCVGTDGIEDTGRIAAVIRELNADVVALQEVETLQGGEPDLVRRLESEGVYCLVPGPTMFKPDSHYGNLLLTRLPVEAVEHVDLSQEKREPRGAIVATLRAEAATVLAVATHFGLLPVERRFQTRALLTHLERSSSWQQAHLRLLMGDFNEWFHWARPLRWIEARFGASPAPATFPASRPLLSLDRIWASPPTALTRVEAVRAPDSAQASDHLPVKATLSLP